LERNSHKGYGVAVCGLEKQEVCKAVLTPRKRAQTHSRVLEEDINNKAAYGSQAKGNGYN